MINTNATLEQLEQLKLHGMVQAYQGALALPSHEQPSAHELIARLAEAEGQNRTGQRTQMYLKLSNAMIYRMARAKKLPFVRFGKTLRFQKDQIDEWFRANSAHSLETK